MKRCVLFISVVLVGLCVVGCNPIEDGITNAVEALVLNSISDIWNSTVTGIIG